MVSRYVPEYIVSKEEFIEILPANGYIGLDLTP